MPGLNIQIYIFPYLSFFGEKRKRKHYSVLRVQGEQPSPELTGSLTACPLPALPSQVGRDFGMLPLHWMRREVLCFNQ